eukprot:m.332344 g.332344  ORF g.332344 m.332344 type:complete len:214 (-) comp16933_c0_seq1:95-736(-)
MAQAPAKWAQREDTIFLTIELTGISKDKELDLKEDKISFKGKAGPDQQEYKLEIEFFKEINVEESKRLENDSRIFLTLKKKESGPYWPRLLKEKIRLHWLKIDFEKWKDEDDDEDEKPDSYDMPGMEGFGGGGMPGMPGGMGGMDMASMLGGMGGAGGMGGMGGMGGGMGGMDMEAMMKQMQESGGLGATDPSEDPDDTGDGDSDDEDMPGLE